MVAKAHRGMIHVRRRTRTKGPRRAVDPIRFKKRNKTTTAVPQMEETQAAEIIDKIPERYVGGRAKKVDPRRQRSKRYRMRTMGTPPMEQKDPRPRLAAGQTYANRYDPTKGDSYNKLIRHELVQTAPVSPVMQVAELQPRRRRRTHGDPMPVRRRKKGGILKKGHTDMRKGGMFY